MTLPGTDFRQVCAGAVAAKGGFRADWVRDAFDAVDRAGFVPSRIWSQTPGPDGLHPVLDRERDPDAWHRAVWDPHRSVITQLDDGLLPEHGPARGDFSSSVSAPDIVAEKLCQLALEPGHRVLELGTGSGYGTALLCERVGDRNVVTVEIDPALSARAADNLAATGHHPTVVTGDGMRGVPGAGPYDRVIATAAVRHIPRAWPAQCAPGALILTPFGTCWASGALLRLAVDGGGRASGRFTGTAHYMWVRGERPGRTLAPAGEATRTASPIEPGQVLDGPWAQDFVLGLRLADVDHAHRGRHDDRQAQLWDRGGTSVTLVSAADWYAHGSVVRYGPRDLWDEAVAAYTDWRTAGRPGPDRHGLTVDPDGTHHAWRDGSPPWPLRHGVVDAPPVGGG
ncbi:methyltransferase domain-containing protein [Streptomyces sp. NPDC054784]